METPSEQPEALSNDKMASEKTRELIQKLEKKEAPFCQKAYPFGLGSAVDCLKKAIKKSQLPSNQIAVVSGLSYPGRIFDYGNINAFQTTYGRAVPFSTGMKLANPKLNVIVIGSDQDLFNIGGSHFIQAARRNIDLTVLCLNNQPITQQKIQDDSENDEGKIHPTLVHGNVETFFNLPNLADMAGPVYVGRRTDLHLQELNKTVV